MRNAQVTVWLNGVKVQDNLELPDKTGHGDPEEPSLLPIRLQNHNCPVRYRNIWIIDRGLVNVGPFPIEGKPEPKAETPAAKEKQEEKPAAPKGQEKAKPDAGKDNPPADAKPAEQESKPAAPQQGAAVKPDKKDPRKPAESAPKPDSAAKEKTEDAKPAAEAPKPAEPQAKAEPPKKDEPKKDEPKKEPDEPKK